MPTLLRWLKEEDSLVSVSLKDIKSEIKTKIKEQNNIEEAFNEMKQEFEKTHANIINKALYIKKYQDKNI